MHLVRGSLERHATSLEKESGDAKWTTIQKCLLLVVVVVVARAPSTWPRLAVQYESQIAR